MDQTMVITAVRAVEHFVVVACTPLLLFIGYRLFVLGVTGQMELMAQAQGWKGKITNASPGIICFILSTALGALVLHKDVPIVASDGRVVGGFLAGSSSLSADIRRALSELLLCERAVQLTAPDHVQRCQEVYELKFEKM